jgi:hypothetical protein
MQVATADGLVSLSFNPGNLHDNETPKILVCDFELVVDSTEYRFLVEQGLDPHWQYGPGKYYGDLIVTTSKGRRQYGRDCWSKKAQSLMHRNLQSLRVYLDDASYCELLSNRVLTPWLERQLALAETKAQAQAAAEHEEALRMSARHTRARHRREDDLRRMRLRLEAQQELARVLS